MRLNAGCGTHKAASPWLNVDRVQCWDRAPDIVADMRALPFRDGVFDAAYLGHVLEHIHWHDMDVALSEVRRVTASGRPVCAVGPDIERARSFGDPALIDSITVDDEPNGDNHAWTCTEDLMALAMRLVFKDVRPVPIAEVGNEWPVVNRVGWQAAVEARA